MQFWIFKNIAVVSLASTLSAPTKIVYVPDLLMKFLPVYNILSGFCLPTKPIVLSLSLFLSHLPTTKPWIHIPYLGCGG